MKISRDLVAGGLILGLSAFLWSITTTFDSDPLGMAQGMPATRMPRLVLAVIAGLTLLMMIRSLFRGAETIGGLPPWPVGATAGLLALAAVLLPSAGVPLVFFAICLILPVLWGSRHYGPIALFAVSVPAALSMIALARKAGKVEFSDAFVGADAMQAMQRRIRTELDPEIEAKGFDKMRSRITIRRHDGSEVSGRADERYRGGPENPMRDDEIEAKVRSCCDGMLSDSDRNRLIRTAWSVLTLDDAGQALAQCLTPDR